MKTMAFLSLAGLCRLAVAQTTAMTTLQIDMANQRAYVQDIPDPQKYASDPTAVATSGFRIFASIINLMDIVAVNGKPAKGTFVARGTRVGLSPNSGAGTAVADVERAQASDWSFEILQDDGTPIGTLMALGLAGGDPPPGGPMNSVMHNMAIVGGTGAFLGARGQAGQAAQPFTRSAGGVPVLSMTADPANRRVQGGGSLGFILQFVTLSGPDIVTTSNGPAVFHADSMPVNDARPARAGEVLTLQAASLGPRRPGAGISPLEVTVGGKPAAIVKAAGWPALAETYQVDFRMPEGAAPGTATIQLTAAWVTGSEVKIAVQ
jgi:hypothetical protein